MRARAKKPLHEVSDKQRSRHVHERGAGIVKLAGGEAGVVDLLFEFLILKSNQKTLRALVQKLRKDDALPIGIFPTEVAPTVMAVDVAVAMIGHLRLSDERYARLRDYMKRGEWDLLPPLASVRAARLLIHEPLQRIRGIQDGACLVNPVGMLQRDLQHYIDLGLLRPGPEGMGTVMWSSDALGNVTPCVEVGVAVRFSVDGFTVSRQGGDNEPHTAGGLAVCTLGDAYIKDPNSPDRLRPTIKVVGGEEDALDPMRHMFTKQLVVNADFKGGVMQVGPMRVPPPGTAALTLRPSEVATHRPSDLWAKDGIDAGDSDADPDAGDSDGDEGHTAATFATHRNNILPRRMTARVDMMDDEHPAPGAGAGAGEAAGAAPVGGAASTAGTLETDLFQSVVPHGFLAAVLEASEVEPEAEASKHKVYTWREGRPHPRRPSVAHLHPPAVPAPLELQAGHRAEQGAAQQAAAEEEARAAAAGEYTPPDTESAATLAATTEANEEAATALIAKDAAKEELRTARSTSKAAKSSATKAVKAAKQAKAPAKAAADAAVEATGELARIAIKALTGATKKAKDATSLHAEAVSKVESLAPPPGPPTRSEGELARCVSVLVLLVGDEKWQFQALGRGCAGHQRSHHCMCSLQCRKNRTDGDLGLQNQIPQDVTLAPAETMTTMEEYKYCHSVFKMGKGEWCKLMNVQLPGEGSDNGKFDEEDWKEAHRGQEALPHFINVPEYCWFGVEGLHLCINNGNHDADYLEKLAIEIGIGKERYAEHVASIIGPRPMMKYTGGMVWKFYNSIDTILRVFDTDDEEDEHFGLAGRLRHYLSERRWAMGVCYAVNPSAESIREFTGLGGGGSRIVRLAEFHRDNFPDHKWNNYDHKLYRHAWFYLIRFGSIGRFTSSYLEHANRLWKAADLSGVAGAGGKGGLMKSEKAMNFVVVRNAPTVVALRKYSGGRRGKYRLTGVKRPGVELAATTAKRTRRGLGGTSG